MNECEQKYKDFFRPLIDKLETEFPGEAVYYFRCCTGRFFPSCLNRVFPSHFNGGMGYAVSFERKNGKDYAWVTFHIRAKNNDRTKEIFDQLCNARKQIQTCIACDPALKWCWLKHDNDRDKFSTINIRRAGSVDDSSGELEKTRNWMLKMLPKFQKVFDPRVAEILGKLPPVGEED